jgi:ribose transport system ATP-binding protein
MSTPVLQLRNIEKQFSGVRALRTANLDAHAGEVVALLGENGAGKSTLMRIAGGIEHPDAGEVLVDGARVVMRDVHAAISHGIAFVHQELDLLDNLDVAGNVLLGREPTAWGPLRLLDRARMRDAVRLYLDQLGLDVSPNTPLAELSIAQQQLVEIAKALSLNARVLIMDEPTSSLTLVETARLHDVVAGLRQRGVAVIYITHRLAEVPVVADRAVVLRDGANAGALAQNELTHDNMVRLMAGRNIQTDRGASPRHADAAVDPARLPGYFIVDGLRTRRYPRHAVSFAVSRGEILGIAGLVGAGRSEVARAIFGIEPAVAGTVALDGAALTLADPASAIRRGVFLVPEDRRSAGLVVDFSIRENVSLPALGRCSAYGLVSRSEERERVRAVCRQLQVKAPSIDVEVATLSGGNQQKVVLAKWLALAPNVLIVDEPTRGIDVAGKAEIHRLLRALAREGVSIVMISSDMEEVLHLSDRVVVMREGRVTGVLERADCSEQRIMALAVARPDA